MQHLLHKIAISMGDPAGVGPELIAKLFLDYPDAMQACTVFGDAAHLARAAAVVAPHRTLAIPTRVITTVPDTQETCVAWGKVHKRAGELAARSIIEATQAALAGQYQALVTAPIHKEALHAAGYAYPGHTEMLQALSAQHLGRSIEEIPVRMMLANHELRTVLHSIHVSLRQAIERVEAKSLDETLTITHKALQRILGRVPRIAVAGLNPHAGEGGQFGREEIDIIAPAVERARAAGWLVEGPFPPDTIFMRARQSGSEGFDAVVAMYHDQGLIPIKYLGLDEGVNVTLGLPFVRTSPDHGTAFDLAGSGQASASSLLAAVKMASALLQSN